MESGAAGLMLNHQDQCGRAGQGDDDAQSEAGSEISVSKTGGLSPLEALLDQTDGGHVIFCAPADAQDPLASLSVMAVWRSFILTLQDVLMLRLLRAGTFGRGQECRDRIGTTHSLSLSKTQSRHLQAITGWGQ